MKLPRVKPGDAITDGKFNALIDAANACNLDVGNGGGLSMQSGPDGYVINATYSEPIWGKITGAVSGGTYPFTQIFPSASGGWADGTLTDQVYEINGNTSVASGKRVLIWRTAQGEWATNAGTC